MNEKSEQMNKFEEVTRSQKEVYENEIEYREEVGKCKGGVWAAYELFIDNPSAFNFSILETKMMRYQNVLCNCRVKEE